MCVKNCRRTRCENVPQCDKWRCRFVAREFRHDDPDTGSTTATGRLVDMRAVQDEYSILCLDAENAHFHAEEDEDVHCWPPKEWVKRSYARGGRVENSWWKLKKQLYGRRKAAKKCLAATYGIGIEQCLEQPTLSRRSGTTLTFECHQDDFYVEKILETLKHSLKHHESPLENTLTKHVNLRTLPRR